MLSAVVSITHTLQSSPRERCNADTTAVVPDTVSHPLYQTVIIWVTRSACPKELKLRQDGDSSRQFWSTVSA